MPEGIAFALLLSTLAGLSTSLGGLVGLLIREPGPRFMSLTLGFSAGVMVLVSFVELLQGAIETIGFTAAHFAFFGGVGAMFLIDVLVPHDYLGETHGEGTDPQKANLQKTGIFVALGIGIHNFPEGMASFIGALEDPSLGVAIAVAIAVHNIPEGLAVAAPIYAATGSRWKAFSWALISGLAEPVGAGLAALVLLPFLSPTILGVVLAAVAGVMVFISMDELVPVASSFGQEHLPIVGVSLGMVVMAVSLGFLR